MRGKRDRSGGRKRGEVMGEGEEEGGGDGRGKEEKRGEGMRGEK